MIGKLSVVVLVALAVAVSALPQKEAPSTDGHRIVGGVEATPHEFPFIVDLRRPSHYCGGAIINEKWIMTAAHCSTGTPSSYVIVAGDHDNADLSEGTEQRRQVIRIVSHPNYNPSTFDNDIALMELEVPLEWNDNVQPVALPSKDFDPTGSSTVAGWGALSEGGSSPSKLYKVEVPLVPNPQCDSLYASAGYSILDSMICAGVVGKDSCQGDSGGPMVCQTADGWVSCGIVSWGIGCARQGYPGVYARTSQFIDFINQTVA